jgi:membrane fusion protein, multidrug efflux system
MYKHSLKSYLLNYQIMPVVFLGLVMGVSCKSNDKSPQSGQNVYRLPVETKIVQPELLIDQISIGGSILPNESVELRNEIPGRVTDILFKEGTHIKKGTLLLKMNDSELQAQLKKTEAQENLIEQDEYRKRKLLEIKAISEQEYEVTNNQLKTIRADKELILAQIEKSEIYAPFDGQIGLRHVSPGSFLSSNSLIASFQQTDPVKIEFSIPERYNHLIRAGMKIRFRTESTTDTFTAEIYAIESQIASDTRTLTARAVSRNPKGKLVPGNFARIDLELTRIPDALMVPSEAVSTEIGGSFLYVYKNGIANSREVLTGIRTPKDIQILEGIQSGDTIITTGLLQMNNGTRVESVSFTTPQLTTEK